MSLEDRCRHAFSPAVQKRGRSYARGGRVYLEGMGSVGAVGAAFGTGVYSVEVAWERDGRGRRGLRGSCECPYGEADLCKHIFALLLVLDEEAPGKLEPPGGEAIPIWLGHFGDLLFDEDDEDEGIPDPEVSLQALHRRARAGAGAGGSGTWQLPAGCPDPHRWRSRGLELEYRLDLAASGRGRGLMVQILGRRPRADGDPGAFRPMRLSREDVEQLPEEARRAAELLLACAKPPLEEGPHYGWIDPSRFAAHGHSRVELAPSALAAVLPALAAGGGVTLEAGGEVTPLSVDGGAFYELALRVEPGHKKGRVRLTGSLQRRGGAEAPAGEAGAAEGIALDAVRFAGEGVALAGHRLVRLARTDGVSGWVEALAAGPVEVSKKEAPDLLDALASGAGAVPLEIDPALGVSAREQLPRPRVRFGSPAGGKRVPAEIAFLYGDEVFALGIRRLGAYDRKTRAMLRRDLGAEARALEAIEKAGVRPARPGVRHDGEVAAAELPSVVRRLCEAGMIVEARGARVRSGGRHALRVASKESSGIDWFDVEVDVHYEGAAAGLPALLEAARGGEPFVKLDDGSLGLVPEEWMRRFGLLSKIGRPEGDAVRFQRSQAALLDALLEAQPEVEIDAVFRRTKERLRAGARPRPRQAPRGFQGTLRGYQKEGLGWLRFLEELGLGGCLADDMGLGKTVQVLAHLASRRARRRRGEADRPALIVVPRSLVFNWAAEAARFVPGLEVLVYHGPGRKALRERLGEADVIVTTYGTLRRDIAHLSAIELDYAVLDEAQAIKNPRSQAARACRLLRAAHRLALTGTPVENRLSDLGSIFEFLNPGMLDVSTVLAPLSARDAGDEGLAALSRALKPFLLRRTKEEVLSELPPKVEQTVPCELGGKQRKLYDELRDHYRRALKERVEKSGLARSKIHVLEALLRLRQAACHPGLVDRDRSAEPSAKLEALLERLVEVAQSGHKALVFSQFTTFLGLVKRRLDAEELPYAYLDGRTRDRAARVAQFQDDPDCRVFLLSLKAAGHGLNLTAADYVFLLDPWWNPATESQAVDRAHRIGQTRRVFTYRLIAQDTVEEKVLSLQADKRRLAEAVVRRDAAPLADLSADDLEFLLG